MIIRSSDYPFKVYNYDGTGTYYNSESGSKKLYEYHGSGMLSWVDDSGDYKSFEKIHEQHFCMDYIVNYYLITVIAGRADTRQFSIISISF